jgi:hypothetical protein
MYYLHKLTASAGITLFVAFACGACTPIQHRIKGEQYTPEKLEQLELQASLRCDEQHPGTPPHPFRTDGCSLWPDRDWQACCVEHDMDYWCGGSAEQRRTADRVLRQCVRARQHPVAASLMYWGTRLGGHPWLPPPWRWGYGWRWPYRYSSHGEAPEQVAKDAAADAVDPGR